MTLLDLYESICSCPNRSQQCPGIINDPSNGIPPRGFYTRDTPESVHILIVGKNPGHLLEQEALQYKNKTPRQMAEEHLRLAGDIFATCNTGASRKNRSHVFHRNILRYFSYVLDVSPEEVFEHCAYTNIVKCQTIGEQDALKKITVDNCLHKHFIRELEYFSPKAVVALGREAFNALSRLKLKVPLLYLKHPSYHYRKEEEADVLNALKHEIQNALGS